MSALINLQCVCSIYPGIFSCRHSGTYLFTYSVNTFVSAYQLVVRLVLEGVNESDAISDPVHTGQVSNSYTFVCPSVRGDNRRALSNGISPVQVDKQ